MSDKEGKDSRPVEDISEKQTKDKQDGPKPMAVISGRGPITVVDSKESRQDGPKPMAVTSGNIVRERPAVDRPVRRSTAHLVDPRTKKAHQQVNGFRAVNDDVEVPRRESHRRSSSWDGMNRKPSPPRSPSPSVEGNARVSQMTNEQISQYVVARSRASPSPGRQVKYLRNKHSPTLKPRSPSEEYRHGTRSSSPRTAAKQLQRELDEFSNELAEIHRFEDSIAENISFLQISADGKRSNECRSDGCKPGEAKQIATPPQPRFKSPKHTVEVGVPPANVVRPLQSRGRHHINYPNHGAVVVSPTNVSSKMDTEKSAFFPAQRRVNVYK
eukprot:m.56587 g.56587  ORF g.56587 m.56587 type:complete len:328 (-) comp22265_c0_seq1:43-1026(-)